MKATNGSLGKCRLAWTRNHSWKSTELRVGTAHGTYCEIWTLSTKSMSKQSHEPQGLSWTQAVKSASETRVTEVLIK
jgi:hypothetical protein